METSDLVLEGGGVKGAGLAGAVGELGRRYEFHRVAGTSAGAIVASLVAAGLEDRLERLLIDTDFASFLDTGMAGRLLGGLGNGLEVLLHEGMHRGRVLHDWIARTLAEAGVTTWGDLRLPGSSRHDPIEHRYRLVVVVSDISRGRMLRLPWDYQEFLGEDPDRLPVADAVRASASIPFFFRPVRMTVDPGLAAGHRQIVLTDGGMLSNYPIGIFDDECDHPTIGIKLSPRRTLADGSFRATGSPLSLAQALVHTMTSAHDQLFIDEPSVRARTVFVETDGVHTTDFRLPRETKQRLYDNGGRAASSFLSTWSFAEWRRLYPPEVAA
ncbi:MAG: patatin-like phospholipase family protein [Nocardioides sp.]|nr:patatin-like phospholipase family protein [Nocardioides sp.]